MSECQAKDKCTLLIIISISRQKMVAFRSSELVLRIIIAAEGMLSIPMKRSEDTAMRRETSWTKLMHR